MRSHIDITGQKFNSWTVLYKTQRTSHDGVYYWKCRCDCGVERDVKGTSLRSGRCKQCGFSCKILTENNIKNSFDKKYKKDKNGCWIWQASLNFGGYGKFGNNTAHRYSWERFKGKIPEEMCVLHKCDVRNCVNPDHLWLGTNQDNTADKIAKGRQIFGEKSGTSKLTEKDVLKIRKMRISGKTIKEISEYFCMTSNNISQICLNKRWKHVSLGEESKKCKRKY
jgi:hypothetical protein